MLQTNRKGIVLAGGLGTRLHPLTAVISKQLLPVYDKPMIYYPLSTLLLAGIRDIVLVSSPFALPQFRQLLGDGSQWGVSLTYVEQPDPNGIAQALILADPHVRGQPSALILGDNIFFGNGLTGLLENADSQTEGATIFSYRVSDPSAYGVVVLGPDGRPLAIEEKPVHPRSNLAVTGLYYYDGEAASIARNVAPSPRGELEITAVNAEYLRRGKLHSQKLHRGFAWFDTGTVDSLLDASEFVRQIERRQGQKIACLEEISLGKKWISLDDIERIARHRPSSAYSEYLLGLVDEHRAPDGAAR